MLFETKNFGEIEFDEDKVITFNEGLPGFDYCKRFLLINEEKDEKTEKDEPFKWLQSVDDGDVAFVLMDVFAVMPDYDPLINSEEIEDLGEYKPEDLIVYNITVIPEEVEKLSVNLKAPVVINSATKLGKQVIANNEEYPIRYHIFEELKKIR